MTRTRFEARTGTQCHGKVEARVSVTFGEITDSKVGEPVGPQLWSSEGTPGGRAVCAMSVEAGQLRLEGDEAVVTSERTSRAESGEMRMEEQVLDALVDRPRVPSPWEPDKVLSAQGGFHWGHGQRLSLCYQRRASH